MRKNQEKEYREERRNRQGNEGGRREGSSEKYTEEGKIAEGWTRTGMFERGVINWTGVNTKRRQWGIM